MTKKEMEVQLALGTVDPLKLSGDEYELYASIVLGGGYSPRYNIITYATIINLR